MNALTMVSRAKINLYLDVVGKREDGYHNIESIMQMVEFGDVVTVEHTKKPGIVVCTNHPELPIDEGNIAYRAAKLMQETYHLSGGFNIQIEKQVPVAAGLAGGSTNAAAVMHLINRLCNLKLSFEELAELGVTLGADVPFCLFGKPALCEGIGEKLTPVSGLSGCYIVLTNPGVGVSTGKIYQALDGENPQKGGSVRALMQNLSEKNLTAAFGDMVNVMEPVAKEYCPEISDLLSKLREAGADHVMMSGSGATCFGIFCNEPDRALIKSLFGSQLVAITKPVTEAQ